MIATPLTPVTTSGAHEPSVSPAPDEAAGGATPAPYAASHDASHAAAQIGSIAPSADVVAAILEERLRQIERFGHDRDGDAAQPADRLLRLAKERLQIAIDRVTCDAGRMNPAAARASAIKAAALIVAWAEAHGS